MPAEYTHVPNALAPTVPLLSLLLHMYQSAEMGSVFVQVEPYKMCALSLFTLVDYLAAVYERAVILPHGGRVYGRGHIRRISPFSGLIPEHGGVAQFPTISTSFLYIKKIIIKRRVEKC